MWLVLPCWLAGRNGAHCVMVREQVALAGYTTLGLGGPAARFVEADGGEQIVAAVRAADRRGDPVLVLGGGSNLVVADAGFPGTVVRVAARGIAAAADGDRVAVSVAAGEDWDALVSWCVGNGLSGLECLSGIPGLAGATPIQNVGAYGQDVAQTVTAVRALDRSTGETVTLARESCGFGYRTSRFKSGEPERFIVLSVTYSLHPGAVPAVRYADVESDLALRGIAKPSLADVRASVLAIRRSKSMVLDPDDPNRRSCGSFFLNPIVDGATFERVERVAGDPAMPRWREEDGRVKLSAAWLIERAGFHRGEGPGPVALSTRHSLAIVCREGARAADVAAFAREIRARVEARFGLRLVPEPVFWGGLAL